MTLALIASITALLALVVILARQFLVPPRRKKP